MTATVVGGVLKPDETLPLAEQSRVCTTIETIGDCSPEKVRAAWESLQARPKEHPIHGGGLRYTRDELHERR